MMMSIITSIMKLLLRSIIVLLFLDVYCNTSTIINVLVLGQYVFGDSTISDQCLNETNQVFISAKFNGSLFCSQLDQIVADDGTVSMVGECGFFYTFFSDNKPFKVKCNNTGGVYYYNASSCHYQEIQDAYPFIKFHNYFGYDGRTYQSDIVHALCAGTSCTNREKSILQNEICNGTDVVTFLNDFWMDTMVTSGATTIHHKGIYHNPIMNHINVVIIGTLIMISITILSNNVM